MEREAELREFVAARGVALSRAAFLLTGDHQAAEDLVQEPPLEVGSEVYRLFHRVDRSRWNKVTHVLKVSRDGCRTWQRVR